MARNERYVTTIELNTKVAEDHLASWEMNSEGTGGTGSCYSSSLSLAGSR